MWHVGVLRGPRGCFCFFSLLYLDNCECIDIISPACCAFSLCYPFQQEFWEEGSWQSETLFLVLHSSLSLSLQVGPDGGFGGRIDRRLPLWCQRRPRFVRNGRRCQDGTLKNVLSFVFCCLFLPLILYHSISSSILFAFTYKRSPSLQTTQPLHLSFPLYRKL